ncbi:MAG TPA: hypothetical protein VJJ55_02360 [Candidatus Paceibacterota bacterium]
MKTVFAQQYHEVFEKLVQAWDGRLFRVRFVVVERGGALRGRVISCTALDYFPSSVEEGWPLQADGVVVFLPTEKKVCVFRLVQELGTKVASPYFNKFAFLTTIKIRAPSSCAL